MITRERLQQSLSSGARRIGESRVGSHLHARRHLALGAALLALILRFFAQAPPPRTAPAVAAMLGDAVAGDVGPDDFVWEERGGFFVETFFGRSVLFLAAPRDLDGARLPADLYRARVRLTRGGRALSVDRIHNLTRTPLGDDRDLAARDRHVAFSTAAYGAVQGITLLDLEGDAPAREASTRWERIRADAESLLATGSPRGLGRTEITFGKLPSPARLELADDALILALGPEEEPAALSLRDGSLNPGPKDPYAASAQTLPHPVQPFSRLAVDALRVALGDWPADSARATIERLRRIRLRSSAPSHSLPARGAPAAQTSARPGDPPQPESKAHTEEWPPPPITPVIAPAELGEGAWFGPSVSFLPPRIGVVGEAPPYLVEASIRPDRDEPRARVHLVAMDMRQVELRIQAGRLAPRPSVGPHGAGRIDASRAERVVAAFNGAPAWGDDLGMVVDRRPLGPPIQGAPTIALDREGHASFGPWRGASTDPLPSHILSLRQSPDFIVGGETPPGASHGGAPHAFGSFRAPGSRTADLISLRGQRAAMCVTGAHHVIYAWGSDILASTLAGALKLARCDYGIHLAMEPDPVGFAYLGEVDGERTDELLHAAMSLRPARLWTGSAHDFFYAVLRDLTPSAPLSDGVQWAPDPGAQPPPAWLPGVHQATVNRLGAQVRITLFAPDRFTWRLRAGSREPRPRNAVALAETLPEPEQAVVMTAVGIGAGRRRGARGLAVEGAIGLPWRGEAGVLMVRGEGPDAGIRILTSAEATLPAGAGAAELPLTADDGKLRPEAREVGSMRSRAAACVLDSGSFAVALTTFDSDEAATDALLQIGCRRVVALDRGTHHPAFLHRTGTDTAPQPRYEPSVLYGLAAPMPGRARKVE